MLALRVAPWWMVALVSFAPSAFAAPEQVHIGLVESDASGGLAVSWLDATPESVPRVVVDTPTGPKEFTAIQVQGPTPGFVYQARLPGLASGMTYRYHVGGRDFLLSTPPGGLDEAVPLTFAALGDMGVTLNSTRVLGALRDLDPAFVLHAGDISYANGDPTVWATWFRLIEPVASGRPWVPVLGNHETYSLLPAGSLAGGLVASPAEEGFFRQRFPLPSDQLWYSFDWAGIHVVAITTYGENLDATGPPPPAEEMAWLEHDLAQHAAAAWKIVYMHEPAYSSLLGDSLTGQPTANLSSARVQRAFVPLFEKYGVDVVVQGHVHLYERSFPLLEGRPVQTGATNYLRGNGVVYVTTGGGGESLTCNWENPTPAWLASRACSYEIVRFDATPRALHVRAIGVAGDPLEDSFGITSTAESAPPRPNATDALPGATGAVVVGMAALARRWRR